MKLRSLALLVLCFSVVACATPSRSSPTTGVPTAAATAAAPSSEASPTASSSGTASGSTIVLHEAPANLGCDSIGVDYTSMTFHIDPAASEQVSATTDTGLTLVTYWPAGFQPGADNERVIRDTTGKVVLSDGEVLQVPPAAYPRLGGYFVCLAPTSVYVLLADPS